MRYFFFENLTYFFIPWSGRKYSHTNSNNSAMTVIAQDDHLTAGVWAACGNKSRKVRKFVYARILPCIPISSTLYCYVSAKKLWNKKTFKFNCRERIRQCIWEVKYRASRYLKLFSCNKLMCSCKNEARVANYCNYKLSRDRKKIVALQHMLTLTKQ